MEMVQFHPTTLYIAAASRALITEAVRGEGAYLVDRNGYRFMKDFHPSLELAPRDVVSRAIVSQIRKTNYTHVFLDVRHLPTEPFKARFPPACPSSRGIRYQSRQRLIPIHPATHYMIGGVECDYMGKTSLDGLYAVGEASCSGLHGADRLASNSLLEGLVFGARAGTDAAARSGEESGTNSAANFEHRIPALPTRPNSIVTDVKSSAFAASCGEMSASSGIGDRLAETREIIAFWSRYVMDKTFSDAEIGPGLRWLAGTSKYADGLLPYHAAPRMPELKAAAGCGSIIPSAMMQIGGCTYSGGGQWKRRFLNWSIEDVWPPVK